MEIRFFRDTDKKAWDEYVQNHPNATLYHTLEWINAIENTFQQKQQSILCWDENQVKGIFPLFIIKTLFSGLKAISIPWAMYGGILSDSKSIEKNLLEFAKKEIDGRKISFLELRNISDAGFELPKQDIYVTYIKELEQDNESILQSIPRKSRASIRNGYKKFNLKAEISIDIDTFYDLYLINKRNLGSPPYPRKFFVSLLNEFKDKAGLLFINYNDKIIAGVLYFFHRDTVYPYFSGADARFNFTNSNNVLYYELMKYALKMGITIFDFGRSRINTGSGKFKKNMGFEPRPLYYYYYSPNQNQIPNISPSNQKFNLISKIWSKLPITFTRIIGPQIVSRVP